MRNDHTPFVAAQKEYMKLVGRTGRAGKPGQAITIMASVDELPMRAIARLPGRMVKRIAPPGFGSNPALAASSAPAFAGVPRRTTVRSFRPRRGR